MTKKFYMLGRPDGLDQMIRDYIQKNPGTNVRNVWKHIKDDDGLTYNELTIRHRIKTLENAGYVWTVRVRNERRCYIDAPVEL